MSQTSSLGEFEVVVLMAVLHLQADGAFGSAILNDIKRRSGRAASRGSVYITLDRLEDKGLLASKVSAGTAVRGGRAKRVFRLTARGTEQLKHSVTLLARMHKGLEPILGDL
jgi:DNA-binding PadR family transcriptional regulator